MLLHNEESLFAQELNGALRACNLGLKKVCLRATPLRQSEANYLQRLLCQSSLSEREQSVVLQAADWRSRGLQAARQRNFSHAQDLFRESRRVVTRALPSRECRAICESFQAAGEAYLDYCLEKFDEARNRLYGAMVVDASLERRGRYDLLHLHRVQLVHNLVRISAREGGQESALHLAWRLLGYLEGSQQVLPSCVTWDAKAIGSLPADLVRAMFDQVIVEMAVIVARPAAVGWAEFVRAANRHLDAAEGSSCFHFPVAHAWLNLKRIFIEDRRLFLTCCRNFLEGGQSDYPVLWFATAVDLVAVCKDINSCKAQWLALDLAWEKMPPVLGDALEEIMSK